MTRSKWFVVAMTGLLMLLLFLLAMLLYSWVTDFIMAGSISTGLIFNLDNKRADQLFSAGAIAMSGLVVGGAAFWSSRNKGLKRAMVAFVLLTIAALFTMFTKMFFIRYGINRYSETVLESAVINYPIEHLRLYEMSLYACVCVVVFACLIRWINGKF